MERIRKYSDENISAKWKNCNTQRQAKKLNDKTKDDDQFNLLGAVTVKTNKNKKKINKLKLEQIKIEQVISLSIF